VAAELYVRTRTGETVYLSEPTWGNHRGLLSAAGLALETYPYYNAASHELEADAMLDTLTGIPPGSLIVLQASSHNPTGADPDADTWDQVIGIIEERRLLPLFDLAYQGLGDGLDGDVAVIRAAAERLPELFVAVSCSKNFGLYRERTGALIAIGQDPTQKKVLESQAANVARGIRRSLRGLERLLLCRIAASAQRDERPEHQPQWNGDGRLHGRPPSKEGTAAT
jgi:aspartate/tyrosine/aromatic aminotransferase